MKIIRLCLLGVVLLGSAGCIWDHGGRDGRGEHHEDRR
jgi:hypothetical protein